MILYPAIDLKDGQCVRLLQGDMARATVFSDDQSRKFNKCISGKTKVDISMIPDENECVKEFGPFKKISHERIEAIIIDDSYSYDFPARYIIQHTSINEVVSYTATYAGQAEKGEKLEAAGYVEQGSDGNKRLLVGSSREAGGEYIRVVK